MPSMSTSMANRYNRSIVGSFHSSTNGLEEQRHLNGSNSVRDCLSGVVNSTFLNVISTFFKFWGTVISLTAKVWLTFVVDTKDSLFGSGVGIDFDSLVSAAFIIPHLILCLVMTIVMPITVCSRMMARKLTLSWEKVFAISCIAVSLDPLFSYIPTIDEKNKCLDMDKKLTVVILVLRSLSDLVFMFRIATRIQDIHDQLEESYTVSSDSDLGVRTRRRLSLLFEWIMSDSILDLLAIFPVQQVAIIIVFFRLESSGYPYKMAIMNIVFLLQLILRAYHVYYSSKKFTMLGKYAKGALHFFLYLLAGHVIGAFWYFFSIQRGIEYWHQVCKNSAGRKTTFYCDDTSTSPGVKNKDEFCPMIFENATAFSFGIYLDAFQSGTTQSRNFLTKFLYTFWWGLRNLSNFGTNLVASNHALENIFTILISVIGLLLFLYLIGNVQTYILWASQKRMADEDEIIFTTHKAIDLWMSRHLSSNDKLIELKKDIKEHIQEEKIVEHYYAANKDRNMDVNVTFFFSILEEKKEMRIRLKEHLCKHSLKKVLRRKGMSEFLSMIIENLEPVVHEENHRVVRSREPIDTMLFIIEGVLVASDQGPNAGVKAKIVKSKYKEGDIFGQEIFRLQNDSVPLSTRDFKCKTIVEAFALKDEKWKSIVSDIQKQRSEDPSNPILLNKAYRKMTTIKWGKIEREIGMRMRLLKCNVIGDQEMKIAISCKEIEILDWLSRNEFSEHAKTTIITHVREKGIVKRTINVDVDVKYLLSQPISDLPLDIQKSIRKQLGMKPLKKVPMLQKMDDSVLSIMCEMYLQPEIYTEQTFLVRAGNPADLMFIIIEGTVICTDMTGSTRRLERGHFYGEDLLSWASPNNLFSNSAPDSIEDVRCHTKVEALALNAKNFRTLVAGFSSQWTSNFTMTADSSQQLEEDVAFPYDKIDQELNEIENPEAHEALKQNKITTKEKEILDWVSSACHSQDITTQIKRFIKISKVVEENIDVNLENVLSILPSNIKQSLKEDICIGALKKVPILENVDEDLLNRICLHLKPVILAQNYVIKAGEKVDRMIIVVKGEVKCTAASNDSVTPVPTTHKILEKGDSFGEELLSLAFPDIFSPPVSNQDFLCQTKVEALALKAKGLESVVSYYRDRLYRSDEQLQELAPIIPFGSKGGVVPADNSASSSTDLDQRLDQLLQLQVSHGRMLEEMIAKLGFRATTPPAI